MSHRTNLTVLGRRLALFAYLIPAVTCAASLKCYANGAELVDIREKANFAAKQITSMEYAYSIRDADGWHANARFYSEGSRFRLNRQDVTGMSAPGKRAQPLQFASAFNDERQQLFTSGQSMLRLKDGIGNAFYGCETPHTLLYAWLRDPAESIRWDRIQSSPQWTQSFSRAQYIGTESEGGMRLELVDIPQEGTRTPCVYRVGFAPDLGYTPMRYDRRVMSSGERASWCRVVRFKTLELDGARVAFPLEMTFEQNSADGASLPQALRIVVDESALSINHDVDDAQFTIPLSMATTVYDVDKQERQIREIRERWKPSGGAAPGRPWLIWAGLGLLVLVGIAAFVGRKCVHSR